MFVQREAKVSRVFPLQCPPPARAVRDPLGPLPFPLSSFLFIPGQGGGWGGVSLPVSSQTQGGGSRWSGRRSVSPWGSGMSCGLITGRT